MAFSHKNVDLNINLTIKPPSLTCASCLKWLVLCRGNASVVVYLTGLVDTSVPASADFPCCVSHQQTKQQLGDTIQTDVPLSCHLSYSEDLHVLMFLFFPFPPLLSLLLLRPTTEKCEGGDPAEADELLPAMEEEVLQTQRKDSLLCQRLQGTIMCKATQSCLNESTSSFVCFVFFKPHLLSY